MMRVLAAHHLCSICGESGRSLPRAGYTMSKWHGRSLPVAITQEGYQLQDKPTRKGPLEMLEAGDRIAPHIPAVQWSANISAREKHTLRSVTDGGQCLSRLTALPDDG